MWKCSQNTNLRNVEVLIEHLRNRFCPGWGVKPRRRRKQVLSITSITKVYISIPSYHQKHILMITVETQGYIRSLAAKYIALIFFRFWMTRRDVASAVIDLQLRTLKDSQKKGCICWFYVPFRKSQSRSSKQLQYVLASMLLFVLNTQK